MAIVVVGGQSRDIGKTSVMAGLIAALPEKNWIALKITQYGHGICSVNGRRCECAADDHRFAILQEQDRSGRKDTSRFLLAGAVRSLWVRVKQGQLAVVMPELRPILDSHPSVMIESNSILNFIRPDLYLSVLRFDIADFKQSARDMLRFADAAVLVESNAKHPVWSGSPPRIPDGIPVYPVSPPGFVSEDLIRIVRSRIG
jgi:hypothetical protein